MQAKFWIKIVMAVALLAPRLLFAYDTSFRMWSNLTYNTHWDSKPNWLYGFLLEGRFDEQPGLFYQGLAQTQVGYRTSKKTRFWFGYTWIPSTTVNRERRTNVNVQRLYQQLEADLFKNDNYELRSRSRIEERQRDGYAEINLIYRQMFFVSLPYMTWRNKYTPFLSNELFINLSRPSWTNQKHVNQNRLMAGFSFRCGKQHTCQLAYLNQFLINQYNSQSNHIFYLGVII